MTRFNFEVEGFSHRGPIPAVTKIGPLYTTSPIPPVLPGADGPSDDLDTQVKDLFVMIGLHLAAAGVDWDDVARIDFFVDDQGIRSEIDEAWIRQFPHPTMRPARQIHEQPPMSPAVRLTATFTAYHDDS